MKKLIKWIREYPRKWIERSWNWLREYWDTPYYKCYWLYCDIRGWVSYNFNRSHMRLVKEAWCSYPFDFAYLYYIEKAKMQEMLTYFSHAKYLFPENYGRYCSRIQICINCIDIFLEEETKPDVYINKKNARRFLQEFDDKDTLEKFLKSFPGVLRARKARRLYYIIRERNTEEWWD